VLPADSRPPDGGPTRAELADRIARLYRETAAVLAVTRAVIEQSRATVARVRAAAEAAPDWARSGDRRL
jgi:hypothetical protein